MKRPILICTLFLAGLTAAPESEAAERRIWKSIAMACVPTHQTVDASAYETSGGRVKHAPGRTGLISFVCPFDESRGLSLRKSYSLRASVKRVAGHPAPRQYVTAQLRAVRDKTGDVFTVLETEFDDAQVQPAAPQVMIWSQDEIIGWNDGLTYYVQLTIRRVSVIEVGGVKQIPSIMSVELIQN